MNPPIPEAESRPVRVQRMDANLQRTVITSLSILTGLFLLWTIAYPDGNAPADALVSLGPPGPSRIFSVDAPVLVSRNESISKWMNASMPRKALIERPSFNDPPISYSTSW
jgi:hypothetical protein